MLPGELARQPGAPQLAGCVFRAVASGPPDVVAAGEGEAEAEQEREGRAAARRPIRAEASHRPPKRPSPLGVRLARDRVTGPTDSLFSKARDCPLSP